MRNLRVLILNSCEEFIMVLANIGHVRFSMVNSKHWYCRCLLIKIYRPTRIVFTFHENLSDEKLPEMREGQAVKLTFFAPRVLSIMKWNKLKFGRQQTNQCSLPHYCILHQNLLSWMDYISIIKHSNFQIMPAHTYITRFLSHILLIELSLQGLVLSDAIDLWSLTIRNNS